MIKILIHHGDIPKDIIVPSLKNGYRVIKYNLIPLVNSPWSKSKFNELLLELKKPMPKNSLFSKYERDKLLKLNIQQSFKFFSESKVYEKKWYRHIVLYLEK